ncbi:hypothetical protein CPB83DRAFT_846430 [Crepidotus variabilis]|uniref:Peptidase C15, pyroglutamyl peptidase I-like protein n=1 Tax=Crepidotus variabilis TaxID=179855 RepID=A0A9P6EPL3_9AGAR|nr:hypothetical protein CPB83DRAFT_846430 [Crepidotus variabilis]
MPAVHGPNDPPQTANAVPPNSFRVLVTGFGPFMHYEVNPSWLAVQPLQNVVLHTDIDPEKVKASMPSVASTSPTAKLNGAMVNKTAVKTPPQPPFEIPTTPRPIHITTFKVPVLYESVLEKVPPVHLRPPVLPEDAPEDCATPPPNGYDFVFHIGVAGRGPLRMERIGHKLGYHMKDASGKYAPVVKVLPKDFSRREGGNGNDALTVESSDGLSAGGSTFVSVNGMVISPAESAERERLGMDMVEGSISADTISRPSRGFGVGYENCHEEYTTDIDVTRLVSDLKKDGVEQIYSSMDAGHYLCDFIYYCSLAEVKRTAKPYEEKRRTPQVLFLHCPPVNQPLSTEQVTDAIKKIIVWVCGEIMIQQARDDAAAAAGVSPAGAPPGASGSQKVIKS